MEKENVSLIQQIQSKIYFIRGYRVLLDSDLAALYGVETKVLNQAVRRNLERFPSDFLIQLTEIEAQFSRSQNVTLNRQAQGKNIKYLPLAFTEQVIAMLSSVLRSKTAIQVNIEIMRAFVKMKGKNSINLRKSMMLIFQEFLRLSGKLWLKSHRIDIVKLKHPVNNACPPPSTFKKDLVLSELIEDLAPS